MAFRYNDLDITRYSFTSYKIRKPVTAALIADLHECILGDGNRLIFDALEKEGTDCVVIAGDLIEGGSSEDPGRMRSFLSKLSALYPVFYGAGNHEHRLYRNTAPAAKKRRFREILGGVPLMQNTSRDLEGTGIRITGLDLPSPFYRRIFRKPLNEEYLRDLIGDMDPDMYNILIAHNPELFPAYVSCRCDLVLSGHLHGGIVRLPFLGGVISPSLRLFPKYDAGLFQERGVKMIVSRGTGSHSIKLRINNKPELIFIRLSGEEHAGV